MAGWRGSVGWCCQAPAALEGVGRGGPARRPPWGMQRCGGEQSPGPRSTRGQEHPGPGAPRGQEHPRARGRGEGPQHAHLSPGGRKACVPPVFEGPSGARRRGAGVTASDLEVGKKEPQPEGEGAVRGSGRASTGDGVASGAETRPQVPSCPTPFGLSQPPGGRVSGSCVFRASVIECCAFQRGNQQEAHWLRHAGIPKPQLFPGPDCLSCGGS